MLPDVGEHRVIQDLAAHRRLRPDFLSCFARSHHRRMMDGRQSGYYAPEPGPLVRNDSGGRAGLSRGIDPFDRRTIRRA